MDYLLKKDNFPVCEEILRQSSEQPVDLDFSLPDYCPDIERILKCRLCPTVTSKNITSDRLDVDGTAVIRLYYLDSKKQAIRLCEHSSPFSCSFDLKGLSQDRAASVRIKTEYLNCRAVGPRRLDIHGAFTVTAIVCEKGMQQYCNDIEGVDIQQKKHTETVSTLQGLGQQQFTLSEVLDIGQGKATPESILRSELCVVTRESKAINDKLMLKADADLRILYVTDVESGAQDYMSFNIPITQVIDVPGITESTINDIKLEVLSNNVSLKSEFDEGSTLVSLEARLSAVVFAYEDHTTELVDDAYSTDHELQLGFQKVPVRKLISELNMNNSVRGEINTGDNNITKVIDLWCDNLSYITICENGKTEIRGKLGCCMLALDSNSVPFCSEKTLDFVIEPELPGSVSDISADTEINATSMSFRISGDNEVEIKAELSVTGCIYQNTKVKCITSVQGLEDRRKEKDNTAAVTLYYADKGESLWDIAQLYCTSVEAIRLENNMTDDVIQAHAMVLIPM